MNSVIQQRLAHPTFFPLFAPSVSLSYLLLDTALAAGHVIVSEVSEAGSVPELAWESGEQLVGAKQYRVLDATLLISAQSKTQIPVSSVEQRR